MRRPFPSLLLPLPPRSLLPPFRAPTGAVYIDDTLITRPLHLFIAIRDIEPGEEITISYSSEDARLQPGESLVAYQKKAAQRRKDSPEHERCLCTFFSFLCFPSRLRPRTDWRFVVLLFRQAASISVEELCSPHRWRAGRVEGVIFWNLGYGWPLPMLSAIFFWKRFPLSGFLALSSVVGSWGGLCASAERGVRDTSFFLTSGDRGQW